MEREEGGRPGIIRRIEVDGMVIGQGQPWTAVAIRRLVERKFRQGAEDGSLGVGVRWAVDREKMTASRCSGESPTGGKVDSGQGERGRDLGGRPQFVKRGRGR